MPDALHAKFTTAKSGELTDSPTYKSRSQFLAAGTVQLFLHLLTLPRTSWILNFSTLLVRSEHGF